MFRKCLRELFMLSRRSSWAATNGVPGAALAGMATIWHGVLLTIPGEGTLISSLNWLASFLLYATIAWVILFIIQTIFVAPFQLWNEQCTKIHVLESEKDNDASRIREIEAHVAQTAALHDLVEEMSRQRAMREKENDPLLKAIFDKKNEQIKKVISPDWH
jgi:hypothetical protein